MKASQNSEERTVAAVHRVWNQRTYARCSALGCAILLLRAGQERPEIKTLF